MSRLTYLILISAGQILFPHPPRTPRLLRRNNSYSNVLRNVSKEMYERKAAPFEQALVDAGMMRLRPVLIHCGRHSTGAFHRLYRADTLWKLLLVYPNRRLNR